MPKAIRLAIDRRWEELVRLVRRPKGPVRASKRSKFGNIALHLAARKGASLEVVRALLDAYPQDAQATGNGGDRALRLAAQAWHNYSPKNHAMLALVHAGHPPSRPWTPETCAILRRLAADFNPNHEARRTGLRALINAHLSRVRTILLVSRRRGVPSELFPLLFGPVYMHDFFE